MNEPQETRLSLAVLWIGRVVYVRTLVVLASLLIVFFVALGSGRLFQFPKPAEPDEVVSEASASD